MSQTLSLKKAQSGKPLWLNCTGMTHSSLDFGPRPGIYIFCGSEDTYCCATELQSLDVTICKHINLEFHSNFPFTCMGSCYLPAASTWPVLWFLAANAVGSRSCTKALARCKEYTLEGGSFAAGRACLSLSLTSRSITPQTVGPICTPIMGEEASLLGVLV